MKDNIILIGFMGCGKSSVGKELSAHLGRSLIDTDQWIEKKQGRRISDIFEEDGEAAFRCMETDCLRELLKEPDKKIISVGGGLPIREENHPLLKELGRVCYLKVTPQRVYERLKDDKTRPLLQVDDPMERIESLLVQRSPIYEKCADVTVEASDKSLEEIKEEIERSCG